MTTPEQAPDGARTLLSRALASGRAHSSFLLSGAGDEPCDAAEDFARGIVCRGQAPRPCGACRDCRLSAPSPPTADGEEREPVIIDGTGKRGPLYRHIGAHPDLYWVDRGQDGTRVRITQVRAVQGALRLSANEGGARAVVIADAEWLNVEAQNALLHLLEEPPPRTCIVLVTKSPAGLLATIRSRCQRVAFASSPHPDLRGDDASEEVAKLAGRLDSIARDGITELLDWAEEYRGARAIAAARVAILVATGSEWLRQRVVRTVSEPAPNPRGRVHAELDAFRILSSCRKDLAQRNANPQMVAERALLAIHTAVAGQ